MKLLPFPWIFATRKLARRMVEHIESQGRIIGKLSQEISDLRRENERLRRGR